jgi:hypothetical protein
LGDSVALYLPTNYSVSDILRYENSSSGAAGAVFELASEKGTQVTGEDVASVAEAVAFNSAAGIAAGAAGLAASRTGIAGTILSALVTESAAGNVANEYSKTYQKTLNPREFMLFKAPSIRQFGFNFTFIPSSKLEAESIPEIIKFFRKASYPEGVGPADIQYQFPDAFSVRFINSDAMIKIPAVVCYGTTVTYNPNTMSFFKLDNNLPVEINLQLSFQELQPISRKMVDQGF